RRLQRLPVRTAGGHPRQSGRTGRRRLLCRAGSSFRLGPATPGSYSAGRFPVTRARGGTVKFVVMAGDGIGEEITAATLQVLESADRRFGLGLEYEEAEIGLKALAKHGTTLPEGVLERARASDGIILGPISHRDYPAPEEGGVNISGVVRTQL